MQTLLASEYMVLHTESLLCSLIPTVIEYREPSVSPAVQQLSPVYQVAKQTNFKCVKNTQKMQILAGMLAKDWWGRNVFWC